MKRDYTDGTTGSTYEADDAVFFTGEEVEHSTAFQYYTLFVVGTPAIEDILNHAQDKGVEHIYLGANQSFQIDLMQNHPGEVKKWNEIVFPLLDAGYWVTLDYDVKYHAWVLENGYNENKKFISQISVKLPHIDQLNYNACIKIDDSDYNYSNPGVWVHTVHDLKKRDVFTDWTEYKEDEKL